MVLRGSQGFGWNLGDEEVQRTLDCVVRNKTIYQKVSARMARLNYDKTWEQCRTKIKNLVQKYKKVSFIVINMLRDVLALCCVQIKDSNNITGHGRSSCPFYEELDAILGTRACSSPPALVDSGGDAAVDISVLAEAVHVKDSKRLLMLHVIVVLSQLFTQM